MNDATARGLSAQLGQRLHAAIEDAGGWLPFDRWMAMALYEPGLGYYARDCVVFGATPAGGSDFVTAPELSPLFGATLARQVREVLDAATLDEVVEFGAGSGALAGQVLDALGPRVRRYAIVDLSGTLRARQRERLARFGTQVQWLDAWPERVHAVVLGNEVLDAMPVKLLHWDGTRWYERGVVAADERDAAAAAGGGFVWSDRPTTLAPPVAAGFVPGTVTEIHPQSEAFVRSLAERLACGVAFFVDYGFPEAEYYHPQRRQGTLMCHRGHRAEYGERAALDDPGSKDITAHVNFTGIALAAQEAGLEVLGYTSQARFLLNCGLLEHLAGADLRQVAAAQKLVGEHEMGELFKVIAFGRGVDLAPLGFAAGDRTHTL